LLGRPQRRGEALGQPGRRARHALWRPAHGRRPWGGRRGPHRHRCSTSVSARCSAAPRSAT
jgi:hypothetical protein